MYKKWDWNSPIYLCPPMQSEIVKDFHKDFNAWDPQRDIVRTLMPIITPASPA